MDTATPRACLDPDELLALIEGGCDPALRQLALSHAASCESCRLAVAALMRAMDSDTGAQPSVEPSSVPTQIDRYRVIKVLGRGGMGVVYEAEDPLLGRHVAIKQLHADAATSVVSRLRREARALARLAHPNVVTVLEAGDDWFVMELEGGSSLAAWQSGRSWRSIVEAYLEAARGLAAAHALGIVHGDFKPHNVLVGAGRVRVADFGLAAAIESPRSDTTEHEGDGTMRSRMVGTPAYMSPEQFAGGRADVASDQFGFCVALFEALAGFRPFAGNDLVTLAAAVQADARRSPPPGAIPRAVARVLARGLDHDPRCRWPTMDALRCALEDAARPHSGRTVVGLLAAAVAVMAVVAVTGDATPAACRDHATIDAAWNPARAQELRAVLLDSGQPYAAASAIGVAAHLDEVAAGWKAAHDEVCRAPTNMGGALACLDARAAALDGLVRLISEADPAVVSGALGAAEALGAADGCIDHPDIAAPSPEVSQLARELAAERAIVSLFRPGVDLTRIAALRDAADNLGAETLSAEARLVFGTAQAYSGAYADAKVTLEDAYYRAYDLGEDGMAADAARNAALAWSWVGDSTRALHWARLGQAVAPGPRRRAQLDAVIGQALVELGRPEEAEVALRNSLDPAAPSEARVAALTMLGTIRAEAGALDEAEVLLDQALAVVEAEAGPGHPDSVRALNALGVVQSKRGSLRASIATFERVNEMLRADLGDDHPFVGHVLGNIALSQQSLGDYAQAYQTSLDVVAMFERSGGPEDPRLPDALHNLANLAHSWGRHAATLQHATAGLAVIHAIGDHTHELAMLTFIARARRELDDLAGAMTAWDEVLALQRQESEPDALGWAHLEAAVTAGRAGQTVRAESHIAAALDEYERSDKTSPRERARAEIVAAQLRAATPEHARAHLQHAARRLGLDGASPTAPAADRVLEWGATWVALGGESWTSWAVLTGGAD